MTGFDMSKKSIRPEGSAVSHSRSEDGRQRRSLSDMKKDDAYPKLQSLFLFRSAEVSPYHICALRQHFRKSFDEAVQMIQSASRGQMVLVGDYAAEILEAKVLITQRTLSEMSAPLMSFAFVPKT